jgi:RNA polymerase sigma factor (sigma-70 family)
MQMNKLAEKEALVQFDNMAKKIARQYSGRNEFDDLYQVAKIGIIDAVRSYDKNRGAKLSTHVFNMILSHVRKFSTKETGIIYYPAHVKTYNNIRIDLEDLSNHAFEDFDYLSIELRQILSVALNTLTDKQKEIIVMKYIEGYSTAEISEILGCSHQNVSSICKKAEKLMKQKIELQGITI